MRPICTKCKIEMEPKRNDVAVWHPIEPILENYPEQIDFVVLGDRYECSKCGANVVTGFGKMLIAADYDQKYLREVRDGMEEQIRILRGGAK